MANPWLAWARGTDPEQRSRAVREAHQAFVANGEAAPEVRSVVLESWQRAVETGLHPEHASPVADDVDEQELVDRRDAHPLAAAMPLVRRLLVDSAADAGHVVAVSDAGGRLLWVEGDPTLRSQVGAMGFLPGALWSEEAVGTNAPGTALAVDHSLQVFASEHFSHAVQPWSCSAAPVHDPQTGALLGVIDLTGGDSVAAPHSLALVEATVAAVEGELRLRRPPAEPATGAWRLTVLGRSTAELATPSGPMPLSLRHAEILLLLAAHPEGITGDQLALWLHGRDRAPVTVRAEMSRLRSLLGSDVVGSKPYQLRVPLTTDVDDVLTDLRRGALRRATDGYAGPVLPRSEAPAVTTLRTQVSAELRRAALRQGGPDVLLKLAESDEGRSDVELLQAALRSIPYGSPKRPRLMVLLEEARNVAAT